MASDDETGMDTGIFEFQNSSKKAPQLGKATMSRQPRPPQGPGTHGGGASTKKISTVRARPQGKTGSTGTASLMGDSDQYILQPSTKFENSYQMTPASTQKFNDSKVKRIIQGVLDHYMKGVHYEPEKCAGLSRKLTEIIKGKVKELEFPRYKYICNVSIGQNLNQGINFVSRSVWNEDTDSYVTASYHDNDLFVVATIFATYFE